MWASKTGGRPDAQQVERSAVEWLRKELDDSDITGSDNFLDAGGQSLVFSRLKKFLADSFGVVLDQKTTYSDSLSAAVAAAEPIGSDSQTAR